MSAPSPLQQDDEVFPLCVERARSNRSRCKKRSCGLYIHKGELRLGFRFPLPLRGASSVEEPPRAVKYGVQWFHLACATHDRTMVADTDAIHGSAALSVDERFILDDWFATGQAPAPIASEMPPPLVPPLWECCACLNTKGADAPRANLVLSLVGKCNTCNQKTVVDMPGTCRAVCDTHACRRRANTLLEQLPVDNEAPLLLRCKRCDSAFATVPAYAATRIPARDHKRLDAALTLPANPQVTQPTTTAVLTFDSI
jgi:hypothetical protein